MRQAWGLCAIVLSACGGRSEHDSARHEPATQPLGCDVVVPDDYADVNQAISAAPLGGWVCLRSGAYPGDVVLRDGVHLLGIDEATVCGDIDASAATVEGTMVDHLAVYGQLTAQNSVSLSLGDLSFFPGSTGGERCDVVGIANASGVVIHATPEYPLRFSAAGCAFDSPGFRFELPDGPALDAEISIRRSRCLNDSQCYDFAVFECGTLAAGSRYSIELVNNLVPHTVLEAVVFSGFVLTPEDATNSDVRLINNTIHSDGDPNYAMVFWPDTNANVVVANNAIANIAQPLDGLPPSAVQSGNVTGWDENDTWFQEGYRPKVHVSPLIGAADPAYLPEDDLAGDPRAPTELESGALRLLDIAP